MSKSPPPRPIPVGRNTNSNDFKSLRCRVFVGNLNTDGISKGDVESAFAKFGDIESCSLHKNFGFVQFEDDNSADAAVKEMHGKTLFGKRIDVNLAGLRRKSQAKDKFEKPPDKNVVVPADMRKYGKSEKSERPPRRRSRSRSPVRRPLSPMSRYDEYRKENPYSRYDYERSAYPPPAGREPYGYGYPARDPYARPYYRPQAPRRPSVDCEIVSLNKEESRYAEDVESRLRSIGLVCNIGYPPAELSTLELIERIARCGTLYAVVVGKQNAEHRSCTLNILHGAKQEHRNMPLADAISLVARNFDIYLRALREPSLPPSPYYPPPSHSYPSRDYYSTGYGYGGQAPSYGGQSQAPARPAAYDRGEERPAEKKLSTEDISAVIKRLKDTTAIPSSESQEYKTSAYDSTYYSNNSSRYDPTTSTTATASSESNGSYYYK